MKEKEYLNIKAQIESEYRKKLDALELIWGLSGGGKLSTNGNGTAHRRGALARQVKTFVDKALGEFSVLDLYKYLSAIEPNVKQLSIATVLRRMNGKEIELVKQGTGRAPSMFKRKETSSGGGNGSNKHTGL